VPADTLVIHGEVDDTVPLSAVLEVVELPMGPDGRLVLEEP
jgi:hypothetical protein